MKNEDREALRLFYQTLAQGSFTTAQIALYAALKGGKDARLAWVKQYGGALNIPSDVVVILSTIEGLTKADLAIIAAAQIAPKVAPKASGFLDKLLYYLNPFNWF